ncbi:hypothetical protein [Ectopseudomonas mendocina]|uniref:Uncharacterized protein n=1 Tax=Ectopseudomonas mendocina S5.2 TaxID=1225174 RepID=A0ABM5VZU2_ECTME|nr:hypothetical protein [Pseudomonas mendocina]ALN20479.1 hypothetical protein DW68_018170 [Pseudomonas mendocina S5.2]KER98607.1 hypothetical protein HN51_01890 [Pseudomonas mendocina]
MTVSFRVGRYLVALLWSWSLPFLIGASLGGLYISHAHIEILEANDDLFLRSFEAVIDQCKAAPSDPANAVDAEQVKGRAPGSSDHASPIRRTEARAERTLERPPP